MIYLAELNADGLCVGTKTVKEMINDGRHIVIASADYDYFVWRKYENGQWSAEKFPPAPPPYQKPVSEEITELKAENEKLKQRLTLMDADFVGFQQFYFEKNPGDA